MAEPLDPAALGVASALKSLRTRTGLREERLQGTELVLDTLEGLATVQALVSAGESTERAIVRAVRAAAGTLAPTMSIVADVSLGLELFADQVPDADLYGQDLGQRREALLRNWNRLHELRSAPPGKAPSPRALRLDVEAEALTALAFALTAGAGPATPAWRSGPSRGPASSGPARLRSAGLSCGSSRRSSPGHCACARRPSSRPRPTWPSRSPTWPGGQPGRSCRRSRRPARWTITSRPGARSRAWSLTCVPGRSAPAPGSSRCRGRARPRPPCSRRSPMSPGRCGTAWSGTPTARPWGGRATCANCQAG